MIVMSISIQQCIRMCKSDVVSGRAVDGVIVDSFGMRPLGWKMVAVAMPDADA